MKITIDLPENRDGVDFSADDIDEIMVRIFLLFNEQPIPSIVGIPRLLDNIKILEVIKEAVRMPCEKQK